MKNLTSLSQLLSLEGSTALITGAAQGIGKAIAERYAEAGANLQLIDINESELAETKKELEETYGITVETYVLDLSDAAAITMFWDSLAAAPDVLVNNAGVFSKMTLNDFDMNRYDAMMAINTTAPLLMCQKMITRRGKAGGTIVNISSIEARSAFTDHMPVYGMSKAAILALTRALTSDYAKQGWKVNSLLPGGINTPGSTQLGITALKHLDFSIIFTGFKFNSRLPNGKLGEPDDIARAALWLGCPASDYMNGSEVTVDGGFLAV